MKPISLKIAFLSSLMLTTGALAAPTEGARGIIHFTGDISNDACEVTGPGMTSKGVFNYNMGTVSKMALGSEDTPATSTTNLPTRPVTVDLTLQCAAGTSVTLELTAGITSGKGAGLDGLAQGAQITLTRPGQNTPLDLTSPTDRTFVANLDSSGKTSLQFLAYYTTQVGVSPAAVDPGSANATVNYTLMYE